MAIHKSAVKAHRQSLVRRERNRSHRSRLRTDIKRYQQALEAGELDRAKELLPGTLSLIDRTVKLGAMGGNAASRKKSRLTRQFNRQSAGS